MKNKEYEKLFKYVKFVATKFVYDSNDKLIRQCPEAAIKTPKAALEWLNNRCNIAVSSYNDICNVHYKIDGDDNMLSRGNVVTATINYINKHNPNQKQKEVYKIQLVNYVD